MTIFARASAVKIPSSARPGSGRSWGRLTPWMIRPLISRASRDVPGMPSVSNGHHGAAGWCVVLAVSEAIRPRWNPCRISQDVGGDLGGGIRHHRAGVSRRYGQNADDNTMIVDWMSSRVLRISS